MNCEVLHWSYRDFREMPEQLRTCGEEIVEVYLKENFIPSIPQWFFEELTRLKFICLAGNVIVDVPEEISLLTNLEVLDLSQNAIVELPRSIGKLNNLICLKLNENKLSCLPPEIGSVEKLETLEVCKNRLSDIPAELSLCTCLKELVLDDNYLLSRIPTRVFTMPQLLYLSAERCNLILLPFTVNTCTLEFVKVFNNYPLTHYPIALERFLQPNYDVFNAADIRRISKPLNYRRINCDALTRCLNFPPELSVVLDRRKIAALPNTLVEICLRCCSKAKFGDWSDLKSCVPPDLWRRLYNGPIANCGSIPCSKDIFSECFLALVKRRKHARLVVFSVLFCSKMCADLWFQYNCDSYEELNWALF